MSKLVSIITTLYNYSNYIAELIESVKKQTYINWELIIVDDCSTDNPYSIIKPYLLDKRISYIRLNKNYGYSHAKNEGIINSNGNYIVMIDADDMLTDKSIAIRVELLDNNADKLWCHGEAWVLKCNILKSNSRDYKRRYREKLIKDGNDLSSTYFLRLIHAQSVMVRKELHEKIGLYDETLKCSSDNEMWRRIIEFGYIPAHTDEYVAIYRSHSRQMHKSEYKKNNIKKIKQQLVGNLKRRITDGISRANTRLLP